MATMPDSFFSWVVFLLNEYGATLLQGAGVTLLLALVGTFISRYTNDSTGNGCILWCDEPV